MNDNLIFLDEFELDKPIYRIFSVQRLEEIFQNNAITLIKPKLWDDPFENFILNSIGVLNNGMEFEIGFRDNFYGQCWSLTKESDAMWRIYSPEKDGVKVKTTIRKLFSPLFLIGGQHTKINGTIYNLSSFIGKVQYADTKSLTLMLQDEERMSNKIYDQSGRGQASTFYFKRIAFKHEKEIRLIYNSQGNNQFDTFSYAVEPNAIFDEIIFDPRMPEAIYLEWKGKLRNWGFEKSIIQSGLYKLKTFRINLRSI
jgi:hypothetical protein